MRLCKNYFFISKLLKLFLIALSFLVVVSMTAYVTNKSTPGTFNDYSRRIINVTMKPKSKSLTIDNLPKDVSVQFNNSSGENVNLTVPIVPKILSSKAADALPKNGSVFVWVLTSPKYFKTRVPAVNETWLKRCDHGQFFTTEPMDDPSIPFTTVFSGMNDSYDELFHKTMKAFDYAYNNISDKFDWYMKKRGYNSGGAGYILSNEAVRILVNEISKNTKLCPFDEFEDLGIARCLASKWIFPFDTRNKNGQQRFKWDPISKPSSKLPAKFNYENFAPEQITFHRQTPAEIRMIEILLYIINDPRRSKYFKG